MEDLSQFRSNLYELAEVFCSSMHEEVRSGVS